MQSLRDDRNRHLIWLLTVSLTLASGVAFADKAKPKSKSVTQPSELMTFENVRVVNAPAEPTAKPAAAKSSASGMRAYVDPATNQLSAPTADQASALNSSVAAKSSVARSSTKSAAASFQADDPSTQVIYGAGTIYAVGEEYAVYQVAHKVGNAVVMQEAIGKNAAEHATNEAPKLRATQDEVGGVK